MTRKPWGDDALVAVVNGLTRAAEWIVRLIRRRRRRRGFWREARESDADV